MHDDPPLASDAALDDDLASERDTIVDALSPLSPACGVEDDDDDNVRMSATELLRLVSGSWRPPPPR